MIYSRIAGTGSYLPPRIMTNDDFAALVTRRAAAESGLDLGRNEKTVDGVVANHLTGAMVVRREFHQAQYFARLRHHAEAMRQFFAQGLHHTEKRTGVLIFASVAERYAEIVADAGINAKVMPDAWEGAVADLVAGLKEGRAADGFIAAIERCGAILAEHFPPGALPRNELPNTLVEI